jgi:nucleotide-binding universal stress UspA family protein
MDTLKKTLKAIYFYSTSWPRNSVGSSYQSMVQRFRKRLQKKVIYLGKETGIEIEIIHVIEMPYVPSAFEDAGEIPYQSVSGLLKQQAERILDDMEKLAKDETVTIKRKILKGHPAGGIIREAKSNDFIIIGNKGMTVLERIFLGSVTENVTHHAQCPVMIVR